MKEETEYDPTVIARWALFEADPSSRPPFDLRLGLQSTPAAPTRRAGAVVIEGCEDIPDGVEKFEAKLKEMKCAKGTDFALIYPQYETEDSTAENAMNYIAGLILDEAEKRGWGFERVIPDPVWED